jgi:hypothetical protein
MSPDVQFAATLFPDTPEIAGARLYPLTLGHALLLTRLESPLMPGNERAVTVADLALALEVCRRPWPRCVRAVQSGRSARAWLSWRALRIHWLGDAEIVAQTTGLLDWLREQWRGPVTLAKEAEGEGSDAPLLASLVSAAMGDLGLSESGAMAMPVARVQWLLALHAERQGHLRIMGQAYQEVMEEARRAEAEWRKQGAESAEATHHG